jgi:hypothetical protein
VTKDHPASHLFCNEKTFQEFHLTTLLKFQDIKFEISTLNFVKGLFKVQLKDDHFLLGLMTNV